MEFITRFGLERQRFTQFVLLGIVLFGLFLYSSFPSREEPQIVIRAAVVSAQFDGMSSHRVEDLITKPLEKKIKEMEEVKDITSVSRTGVSEITVELHDRYFDVQPIWQKLRNKMNDAKGLLPEGTQGPNVNDDYGRVSAITLALHGEGYDYAELRQVARDLQDVFTAQSKVARVTLHGVQEERIWLNYNEAKLLQNRFSTKKILNELKARNIILPGGVLEVDGDSFVIEPSGNFQSVEDIRNTLISVDEEGGTLVYLRDLVDIERGYQDPPVRPSIYNGKPAVILGISQIPNTAIAQFAEEVDGVIAQQRQLLPVGLNMDYVAYQPAVVKQEINNAMSNLGQTIAVVLVIVMVFLGLKLGVLVGTLVPLTILLSLIGMSIWGIELQIVSIAAIIIALGLLVDNGIVITEDIKTRLDTGEEKFAAALACSRTLAIPLLSSSLTTILAFMPLMLADNVTGEYIASLSQVIILTLLSSWFLSIYILPMLYVTFVAPSASGAAAAETKQSFLERRIESLTQSYSVVLKIILKARVLFLMGVVAVFALSIYGMSLVPQEFMPPSTRNQFVVYLDLPAGTDIRKTQKITYQLSRWLADREINPEVVSNTAHIGHGGPRFILSLNPPDAQPNSAFLIVTTENAEQIEEVTRRTQNYVLTQLPDARARLDKLGLGGGGGKGMQLRLIGPSYDTLLSTANGFDKAVREIPGIKSVHNDWENPVVKVLVKVDQARARRAGLTSETIAQALQAHFSGVDVSSYREGDKVIPIRMRAELSTRQMLESLRQITIASPTTGNFIPLLQVVEFDDVVEPSQIRRRNLERTLIVTAKHKTMTSQELEFNMQSYLETLQLPPGHRWELGGDSADSNDANQALFQYMPACLMGIVVLLVLQFNSLRRPAIILLTIPLCLIGAVSGLLITGATFGFMSMLGLFSLAGIIVNNGIVLIERIEEERSQEPDLMAAIVNACKARLRPIVVTTCTTSIGLIPLILFGGALWNSMGIVIAFGIIVGSVLTLGVVPALYALFFGAGRSAAVRS